MTDTITADYTLRPSELAHTLPCWSRPASRPSSVMAIPA